MQKIQNVENVVINKSLTFATKNPTSLDNSLKFYSSIYGVDKEIVKGKLIKKKEYKEYIENGGN